MKTCPTPTHYRQRRGLSFILLIAVIALWGCGGSARVEERSSQSIRVQSQPKVTIENFQGPINVSTHNQPMVSVEITKVATDGSRAKAQADLKDIEVTLNQEADKITVIARKTREVSEGSLEAQLNVKVPTGSWVDVMSGLGDISFEGELPGGEHSFQSGSGAILLYLPEDISFTINALTGNGKISSEIPIQRTGEESENILIGASGESPLLAITTTTSNGDIIIRRGK